MDNFDKDIEIAADKFIKKKIFPKDKPTPKEPSEPTDAAGWLRKAYIDHDPADGAPMVGKIGYV
jgi:hypothetical protein|tara:strand:- start:1558 stop:1749 length:192 start_codon:yes stop_codon:yes gene_type:complete